MTIQAYPLQWPAGWVRTPAAARAWAKFGKRVKDQRDSNYARLRDVTVADGLNRVRDELRRMGILDDDLVISTNLRLRLDGWPRSDQGEPGDPGVAVYWQDCGDRRCMAIDRYARVADNLAAVAATLDAMRAIERHGSREILDRAFTGFVALPSPEVFDCWAELGLEQGASSEAIEAAYRRKRSESHPDKGGDDVAFARVTRAYTEAMEVPQGLR